MNPVVKEKWIARLKSGSVRQGFGSLGMSDGSRCCLGVLQDIAVQEGVIPAPVVVADSVCYRDFSDDGTEIEQEAHLSRAVVEWAELPSRNPMLGDHLATYWNDEERTSFMQIADLVWEHL